MKEKYTASEALQIRTTFAYLMALTMTLTIATGFLIYARMPIRELLPSVSICFVCIVLAFIQYRLKVNRRD